MRNPQKTVDELRPIDDTFIRKLGEHRAFCEEMLQTVMQSPDLKVISCTVQKNIHNIDTRSVTVDILCKDVKHDYFSVEVQKADDDDHQKRVRYNGACVQILSSKKGTKFTTLPDVYMIYITEKDIFKRGKTIYHFDRIIRETGEAVDNGYHEIYVNAEIHDGTVLAEYMEIFSSPDVHTNIKFPNICNTVSYYKEGKGRETMCTVVEEYAKEYAEDYAKECIADYAKKKAIETAKLLLEDYVNDDTIVKATGLSLDELSELKMNL